MRLGHDRNAGLTAPPVRQYGPGGAGMALIAGFPLRYNRRNKLRTLFLSVCKDGCNEMERG
jgi:hypothetical protein